MNKKTKGYFASRFGARVEWRQIIKSRKSFIEKQKEIFLFKESENALRQKDSMWWTYNYDKNKLEEKNIWKQPVAH